MRMEEIKGRAVVSIAAGTRLGSVDDLLLDNSYLQIAAVGIGGGGLFGGHKRPIAYASIRGIGPDAVMVGEQDALQESAGEGPLGITHPMDEMRQEVMSESGVNLGRVVEMEFEPQTGAVTGVSFATRDDGDSEEGEVCEVMRDNILTMTANMVIVRHSVVKDSACADPSVTPADRGQMINQGAATAEASAAPVCAPLTN
jgi:uncharacterized protein YrrD